MWFFGRMSHTFSKQMHHSIDTCVFFSPFLSFNWMERPTTAKWEVCQSGQVQREFVLLHKGRTELSLNGSTAWLKFFPGHNGGKSAGWLCGAKHFLFFFPPENAEITRRSGARFGRQTVKTPEWNCPRSPPWHATYKLSHQLLSCLFWQMHQQC